ncbi:MAG: cold shock domain-containing protein [Ardenticatenaceae bacterium]|nr:cold shock domain-containing protein [Ardenticatenaceae bacterium]
MNFRDTWATDENGNQFVFTVEMQRMLSQAGLPVEPAALAKLRQKPSRSSSQPAADSSRSSIPTTTQEIAEPASIQIDPLTGKYIGRVKWYNVRKKYGFIMRGGGEEIFFHESGLEIPSEILQEGAWVLYDVEETFKGPEATDLEAYIGELPA